MKINYKCNCSKPNFENNYTYWEDKDVTSDEKDIIFYLENNISLENKNILHIGIGNSFLSQKLLNNNKIYGISISKKEIDKGKKLNLRNYHIFFCDKYSVTFSDFFLKHKFDIIIDNNLKSYSCCNTSFFYFFENLSKILTSGGILITSRKGMAWYKKLISKMSFNFKYFLHYKLKEVDGNKSNIMTIEESKKLSKKYSLNLYFDEKICYFKKI